MNEKQRDECNMNGFSNKSGLNNSNASSNIDKCTKLEDEMKVRSRISLLRSKDPGLLCPNWLFIWAESVFVVARNHVLKIDILELKSAIFVMT